MKGFVRERKKERESRSFCFIGLFDSAIVCLVVLKVLIYAHGELGNPSKKHGVWCLQLFFGASGMKGILDVLMGFQFLTTILYPTV